MFYSTRWVMEKFKHRCSVCDKTFTEKSNLTRHLKIHADHLDFHCQGGEKGQLWGDCTAEGDASPESAVRRTVPRSSCAANIPPTARPASGPVPARSSRGWKKTWWEAEVSCHQHFVSPVGCGKQIAHTSYHTHYMCILYFQIICWRARACASCEPARSAHGVVLLHSAKAYCVHPPPAKACCAHLWTTPCVGSTHTAGSPRTATGSLPPSCFVGHRAARALYLLHQQSRHSCRTSPRGHVGLAMCLIVVDSGRGTHLPRTKWLEAPRRYFPTVHPLGNPPPLGLTMWCTTALNTLKVWWMWSWKRVCK